MGVNIKLLLTGFILLQISRIYCQSNNEIGASNSSDSSAVIDSCSNESDTGSVTGENNQNQGGSTNSNGDPGGDGDSENNSQNNGDSSNSNGNSSNTGDGSQDQDGSSASNENSSNDDGSGNNSQNQDGSSALNGGGSVNNSSNSDGNSGNGNTGDDSQNQGGSSASNGDSSNDSGSGNNSQNPDGSSASNGGSSDNNSSNSYGNSGSEPGSAGGGSENQDGSTTSNGNSSNNGDTENNSSSSSDSLESNSSNTDDNNNSGSTNGGSSNNSSGTGGTSKKGPTGLNYVFDFGISSGAIGIISTIQKFLQNIQDTLSEGISTPGKIADWLIYNVLGIFLSNLTLSCLRNAVSSILLKIGDKVTGCIFGNIIDILQSIKNIIIYINKLLTIILKIFSLESPITEFLKIPGQIFNLVTTIIGLMTNLPTLFVRIPGCIAGSLTITPALALANVTSSFLSCRVS